MTLSNNRRVPYISQMRQTECGLCCVAMLLQYYNSYEGIHTIRKALDVGRDGIKLSELSHYLTRRGLNTKIYKSPTHFLGNFKLPAIIFWDQGHFVILEKISGNHYYIVDPAFGRTILKKENFMEHYSEIIMTAEPTEDFIPYTHKKHLWRDNLSNMSLNKGLVFKIVTASIITYILQLVMPVFVQHIIDKAGECSFQSLYGTYFPLALGIGRSKQVNRPNWVAEKSRSRGENYIRLDDRRSEL